MTGSEPLERVPGAAGDDTPDGTPDAAPDAAPGAGAGPATPSARRSPAAAPDRTGTVRVDLRGARLAARLAAGDVAVLDRLDLDLVTAHALLARRPAAVVNITSSASGRAPGLGAAALVAGGVRVVDDAGPHLLAALDDGDVVTVTADGRVLRGGAMLATGRVLDEPAVARVMQAGRASLGAHVAAFGAAAAGVLDADCHAVLPPGDEPVPDLAALLTAAGGRRRRAAARALRRRAVLVVAGGPRAATDLALARRRLPRTTVVVATVEGADTALARGLTPAVIVGDARAATARALAAGPAVVQLLPPVAGAQDVAEARERLDRAGATAQSWRTGLGSADAAVLLAVAAGAPLAVTAGFPHGLLEFADRSPREMAGAALVTAAVGHHVVDAATLPPLTSAPAGWAAGAVPAVAGLVALAAALGVLAGWTPGDWPLPEAVADALARLAGAAQGLWAGLPGDVGPRA